MNLQKFFRSIFKHEPKPLVYNFDKKLVTNLSKKFWPSSSQLHYLNQFLSKKEKLIIKSSFLVIILSTLALAIIIIPKHWQVSPGYGGEYTEAIIGQPKMINPIFSNINDVDADITPLIYANLFKFGNSDKLIPELAAGYTISEDQTTYTVKLRQDAFWTDGKKINANDVIFTFETIQNPKENSPLYLAFNGVVIKKINEFEVSFTLKKPYSLFDKSLVVGIIPEHIFGQVLPGNMRLAKENLQPEVTSGQWKFSKLIKTESNIEILTLIKNDRYFGELPFLKKLSFKFYSNFSQIVSDLRSKSIMGMAFLPKNLIKQFGDKNFNSYPLSLPQYSALFFNQSRQPLLKKDDLRLALSKSINKKSVLEIALDGQGSIINSPILSGFLGYNEEIEKIEFNTDEANKLLDKTWERITPEEFFKLNKNTIIEEEEKQLKNSDEWMTNSTTILENITIKAEEIVRAKMNKDQVFYRKNKTTVLSLTLTTANTPEYQSAANTIAAMWRNVGIQVEIIFIEGKQIAREILKGRNYEILLYGEIIGNNPDPFPFWHSSQTEYPGLNLALFSNRKIDTILENARIATSTQIQEKYYKDFQDILLKELPAIFLYSPGYKYLIDKKIKGVEINKILSPSDRFNALSKWYIKTKYSWK